LTFYGWTKLERFVAVQLVWVRLRRSESPELSKFFFKKLTLFKHILIQIFA